MKYVEKSIEIFLHNEMKELSTTKGLKKSLFSI